MARNKRILSPTDAYYHVYNRGVAKMDIVKDDDDRRIFFKFLGEAVKQYPCQLIAYCLMDNHFHLLIKTEGKCLDRIMWHIQSHFARRINLRYQRVGPLFQGRYQNRLVENDEYMLTVLRYIHHNPVKANLVSKPENYRWSSYGAYVGTIPIWSWLNTQWALNLFNREVSQALIAFEQFHIQQENDPLVPWPNGAR